MNFPGYAQKFYASPNGVKATPGEGGKPRPPHRANLDAYKKPQPINDQSE